MRIILTQGDRYSLFLLDSFLGREEVNNKKVRLARFEQLETWEKVVRHALKGCDEQGGNLFYMEQGEKVCCKYYDKWSIANMAYWKFKKIIIK